MPPEIQQAIADYNQKNTASIQTHFKQPLDPLRTQTDYRILRHALEEVNPNLYNYHTKTQMDSLFDAHEEVLSDSIYYLDFIRLISRTLNFMACGHSGWTHAPSYLIYRDSNVRFFPLKLFVRQNKYRVKYSSDHRLQAGDRILEINGQSPKQINDLLRQYMYQDGAGAPDRTSEIERYFENAYSNFIAQPDSFHLKVENSKGEQFALTLAAMSKTELNAQIPDSIRKEQQLGRPLRFTIDSVHRTGIYTIKWFKNEYITHYGQDFNAFTDSVFNEIKKQNLEHLIVDLRGNKGGWTANGKTLFSYFIDHSMPYIKEVEFKRIDSFSFRPLIVMEQGIKDSMQFEQKNTNTFTWINYPSLQVEPAKTNGFTGQVYILIDDMSRSCAGVFSALMQAHTNAIFIGEENACSHIYQGGMVMAWQLPYTRISIHSSTAKYYLNVKNKNDFDGVKVDYEVISNWEDYKKQIDPQMQKALEVIAKQGFK